MSKRTRSLAFLSGKGGSGKTLIALAMAKILSEAGHKVLLVDCDVGTHGATYFYEEQLTPDTLSLTTLATEHGEGKKPIETGQGFDFIPSTATPEHLEEGRQLPRDVNLPNVVLRQGTSLGYDVILLDCQAGFSPLVKQVAKAAEKKLLVLEPDAVSSSALRVLYFQLGPMLRRMDTWQVFNKITEEERPIYEKITGGTLFPAVPPIPFDWQVRAAFAVCSIPGVTSKSSAFGLGVLRILRILFTDYEESLEELEGATVGAWYEEIAEKLTVLNHQKLQLEYGYLGRIRSRKLARVRMLALVMASFGLATSVLAGVASLTGLGRPLVEYVVPVVGLMVAVSAFVGYAWYRRDMWAEEKATERMSEMKDMETEMERYRTLLTTDPRLREYVRQRGPKVRRYEEGVY